MAAAVHIQRHTRGRRARQLAAARRQSRELLDVPSYRGPSSIQATKSTESLSIIEYVSDRGEEFADSVVPMAAQKASSIEASETTYDMEDGATVRKTAEEKMHDYGVASGSTYAFPSSRLLGDYEDTNPGTTTTDDRAGARTPFDGNSPDGSLSEKEITLRVEATCRIQVREGFTVERAPKPSGVWIKAALLHMKILHKQIESPAFPYRRPPSALIMAFPEEGMGL